ncbi:hypothetical protein N0V90_010530 [Kalmusia sp. IMI 367209]|nr:hypothetical protein N0V90_010530 [Kalmusia sp. IMI 367209]
MSSLYDIRDEPTTYNELLDISDFLATEHDYRRIETVAAALIRIRLACAENIPIDAAELLRLLADLEGVGVRGWYVAHEATKRIDYFDSLEYEVQFRNGLVEELKEEQKLLRGQVDELLRERLVQLQPMTFRNIRRVCQVTGLQNEEKVRVDPEQEDDGAVKELAELVERLDGLVNQFNRLLSVEQSVARVPPPDSQCVLYDIEEDNVEVQQDGNRSEETELLGKQESTIVEKSQTKSESPVIIEAGSTMERSTIEYPPPLFPANDESKTMWMPSNVEHILWTQDCKDGECLLKSPGSPLVAQPPPSDKPGRDFLEQEASDGPWLRGGASSPGPASECSWTQNAYSLGDHCGIGRPTPTHEDQYTEHLQVWVEYARILQLQNASHDRMIDHLQEILKDTEETIEWQDQELSRAYCRIGDLKRKMHTARQKAFVAGEEAKSAKAEARMLQHQMLAINEQAVQFCAKLDEQEQQMLALYPESPERELLKTVEMRGGAGGSHLPTTNPSPVQSPVEPEFESSTQTAGATGFYFFPSASIIVLLSNPLCYFQYPKHTSLPQIRQILKTRCADGQEQNQHLRQIHDIFENRDDIGVQLPDTSTGRQVFISMPEIKDDSTSEKGGHKGKSKWDRSFGPYEYQYEHMLKKSIESLRVPVANDRSHLSPVSGTDDGKFCDAGDLINKIEHEAERTMARSDHMVPHICKEIPSPIAVRSLNERRNFYDSLSLPPTTVGSMFPTGRNPRIQRQRSPVVPEAQVTPHPAHIPKRLVCSKDNHPSKETDAHYKKISESDRPANFVYELGIASGRPSLSSSYVFIDKKEEDEDFKGEGKGEENWEMWRHKKGEGCEVSLPHSRLDATRDRCSHCDLPFVQKSWRNWEFEDGLISPHDLKGKALVIKSRPNSPKISEDCPASEEYLHTIASPLRRVPSRLDDSTPPLRRESSNPYLRGGAEEIEWTFLQNARYDATSLGWMEDADLKRPLGLRKRFLEDYYHGKTDLPIHSLQRRRRSHDKGSTENQDRFTLHEKSPIVQYNLRGGHLPPPNKPMRVEVSAPPKGQGRPGVRTKEFVCDRLVALSRNLDMVDPNSIRAHSLLARLRADIKVMESELGPGITDRPKNEASPSTDCRIGKDPEKLCGTPSLSDKRLMFCPRIPSLTHDSFREPSGQERRCQWIPVTVAGPSKEKRAVKRADGNKEYDGMVWGS